MPSPLPTLASPTPRSFPAPSRPTTRRRGSPPVSALGEPGMALSAQLRARTRVAHQAVEGALALDQALADRRAYGHLLAALRGFYAPLEVALENVTGWDDLTPPIDLRRRRRAALLDDDVRRLGVQGREDATQRVGTDRPADLAAIGTLAAGLGCLYVLEGSALGGRIVAQRARAELGQDLPVSFFASTARADLSGDWRALRAALDAFGASRGRIAAEETTDAALRTFAALGTWLAPPGAALTGRPPEVVRVEHPIDFVSPGQAVDLTSCDREPIHLSGAIQPHGVLLAVSEHDLRVRWASANTPAHLDAAPADILGAPLGVAIGAAAAELLRDALADPRAQRTGPFSIELPCGRGYEMTWHRADDVAVVELEPVQRSGQMATSASFEEVRRAISNLQSARGVQGLCETVATDMRQLTGYDRVMVYKFHADWHGEVVAEDTAPGLVPYLGLHYPASDIPQQARRLYLLNHLRLIADVDYEPVSLLGAPEAGDLPPDLSLSGLRSVSPMHLAYLRNMGVGATLTISLLRGTRLWGMLACHHTTPKRIDAQLRASCRVLGQVFSLQVVTQEDHERATYRSGLAESEVHLVGLLSGAESLAEALAAAAPSCLAVTAADGMVARIDGQTSMAGSVPPEEAVDALVRRLVADDQPSALICDDLPNRFPELAPYADLAAGVLALPLSAAYEDFVIWFRGQVVHNRLWGGNPDKAMVMAPETTAPAGERDVLGPRHSFDAWVQEVRGRCRPWLGAEVDAARALASAIPELQVARARARLADLARVSHLATHDPLTGLPNRTLLIDRTAAALDRTVSDDRRVALLFIDLDRFKLVNDSLGHAAGDNLLRQAAHRISSCTRETETVARIGGDEFVVLCEDVSAERAGQLGDRIVQLFRTPFLLDGHEARITTSIGTAVAEPGAAPADLLRDADSAMYRAKHSGRNAVTPFTQEMRTVRLRRVEIETNLRPALERGDLRLYFQPIHTIDGDLTGFEALARWPLRSGGMVPPAEFVPIAEAVGLSAPLTEWALSEGLAALACWRAIRPDLELTVAVNMTASLMATVESTERLERMIDENLRRHRVPDRALCLEITEGALVTDDALSQRFLRRLRRQGVRLSIDDFGTGFSSLAYLTKLPVHELKIDQAFVSRLPASKPDVTVVASVVGLAHQLGLLALAEGVETEEQLSTVRRLGCDLVQGYLLGRPMDTDAAEGYARRQPDARTGGPESSRLIPSVKSGVA
jgi:diguanylate cyclase (GGDEF)-like protein